MRHLCLHSFIVIAAAALVVLPAFSQTSRVTVCHTDGQSIYRLIEVSEFAVPAHRRHGDALPGEPVPTNSSMVFAADCSMELPSPIVEAGYSNLTEEGSVRFRQNNSGNEVYLGKSDLGVGANRVEAGYVWQDGSHQIVFSYDGAGNISTSVDSGAASLSYAITPSCNSGGWDTMDILVVDRSDATAVTFEDVDLNGFDLGNFGSFDVSGTPGFQNWTVTAFDFTQAWTLTGTLRIQNFAGSAELNKLQLTAGCLP